MKLFKWVHWEINRLPRADGNGRPRNISLGFTIRWSRGSLSWKAAYEWDVRIWLLLWELQIGGFIPHQLDAAERRRLIESGKCE